jgi:hypothetical protein
VLTNGVRRGMVYLPLDELEMVGLSEEDIFNGCITDEWRSFMRAKAPPSSTRTGAPMAGETTNNFDHCFIDRNSSASITEKNNGLFQINKIPSLMDVSTELGAGSTRCWARPDLLLTLLIF